MLTEYVHSITVNKNSLYLHQRRCSRDTGSVGSIAESASNGRQGADSRQSSVCSRCEGWNRYRFVLVFGLDTLEARLDEVLGKHVAVETNMIITK